MAWHAHIIPTLRNSSLFQKVALQGAKIRAWINLSLFLDLHYDPTTGSYSYAVIDLSLPYAGDKRLFGWDDFPHPGNPVLTNIPSYPHHFQRRQPDGHWDFSASIFSGHIEAEIPLVLDYLREYLASSISTNLDS